MIHGLYHVAWEGPPAARLAQQLADLRTCAAAGFDAFHTSHLQDVEGGGGPS